MHHKGDYAGRVLYVNWYIWFIDDYVSYITLVIFTSQTCNLCLTQCIATCANSCQTNTEGYMNSSCLVILAYIAHSSMFFSEKCWLHQFFYTHPMTSSKYRTSRDDEHGYTRCTYQCWNGWEMAGANVRIGYIQKVLNLKHQVNYHTNCMVL